MKKVNAEVFLRYSSIFKEQDVKVDVSPTILPKQTEDFVDIDGIRVLCRLEDAAAVCSDVKSLQLRFPVCPPAESSRLKKLVVNVGGHRYSVKGPNAQQFYLGWLDSSAQRWDVIMVSTPDAVAQVIGDSALQVARTIEGVRQLASCFTGRFWLKSNRLGPELAFLRMYFCPSFVFPYAEARRVNRSRGRVRVMERRQTTRNRPCFRKGCGRLF